MQPDPNEILRQIAVLKESYKTMEATAAKHKAESDSAIERLRTSFEGLRKDISEQSKGTLTVIMIAAGLIIASIGVAATILGIVLSSQDTPSQPPVIIYSNQLPAVQAPATPTTDAN